MALALNVLRNREDAEDVCQDTFIKVFFNLEKYDPAYEFRTWFYTVLSNRCRDRLRMRGRFLNFVRKAGGEARAASRPASAERGPGFDLDENLLHELSPKERITVCLWAQEGYNAEEISEVLHCAPSTVRVHLFKARRKIKAILEKKHAAM